MSDSAPGNVVLAVLGYLVVAAVVVLYVTIPVVLLLSPLVAAAGALAAFGVLTATFSGAVPSDTAVLPDDQGFPPGVHSPRSRGAEPAWPHYLRSQLSDDAWTATGRLAELAIQPWKLTTGAVRRLPRPELWVPVVVAPYLLCAAATVAVLVTGAVAGALIAAAAGLLWIVRQGGVRAVRLIDRVRQRRVGSAATCTQPGCHQVSDLPVVQCACARRHFQLKPGWFGVFRRRCVCGRVIASTVTRAASSLLLRCPLCESPLLPGAMLGTDVRIAVIGARGAGKSRFAGTAVATLQKGVRSAGGEFEILAPLRPTNGTSLPSCTSMAVSYRRGQGTVHLFDAPGQLFENRQQSPVLHYLEHVHGLVLVIDPVVLPRLVGGARSEPGAGPPAEVDPELAYRAVTQRLRDGGADPAGKALAVVLTKADALQTAFPGLRPAADSARARRWLLDHGVDNLVLAAERDFDAVRYFVSASLGEELGEDSVPAANAIGWLVTRAGLPLPRIRPSPDTRPAVV